MDEPVQADRAVNAGDAPNALVVKSLGVRFGETVVFSGLSFTVPRAGSLAIVGPNGAGKTVLLRALVGALPQEGSVVWALGTRIGYVPQSLGLQRDLPLTALEILGAKARLGGAEASEVATALARVGLGSEVAGRPIRVLSAGQFQRMLFALALVGDPTVLMLDEPLAGVDEPGQERLNELVDRVQAEHGLAVIFVSHDLTFVYRRATSVVCLGLGRTCFGPPKTLLTPEILHEMYGEPLRHHVHAS